MERNLPVNKGLSRRQRTPTSKDMLRWLRRVIIECLQCIVGVRRRKSGCTHPYSLEVVGLITLQDKRPSQLFTLVYKYFHWSKLCIFLRQGAELELCTLPSEGGEPEWMVGTDRLQGPAVSGGWAILIATRYLECISSSDNHQGWLAQLVLGGLSHLHNCGHCPPLSWKWFVRSCRAVSKTSFFALFALSPIWPLHVPYCFRPFNKWHTLFVSRCERRNIWEKPNKENLPTTQQ